MNEDMKTSLTRLKNETDITKYGRVNGKHLENVARLFKESLTNHVHLLNTWMKEVELPNHEITNLVEEGTKLEGIVECTTNSCKTTHITKINQGISV